MLPSKGFTQCQCHRERLQTAANTRQRVANKSPETPRVKREPFTTHSEKIVALERCTHTHARVVWPRGLWQVVSQALIPAAVAVDTFTANQHMNCEAL